MNILIDNGCHHLRNMGDVAMLQVAVRRFMQLWPDAVIRVVADDPRLLKTFCPGAEAIPAEGHRDWFRFQRLFGPLHRYLPKPAAGSLSSLEDRLRIRHPSWYRWYLHQRMRLKGADDQCVKEFGNALLSADMVAISGGGDYHDAFESSAVRLLDVLETASRKNAVTGMLGQGLGPVEKPGSRLIRAGKRALPLLDLICIRENRTGPPLLRALSVNPSRVIVTGDDAVELAYEERVPCQGPAIGANVRMAGYAAVGKGFMGTVRECLRTASEKYRAPLIPVPISLLEHESDISAARELLSGLNHYRDSWQGLDSPQRIIRQAGHARVVVTGSYHAAVFALAQGIPAVCIAQSGYYADKFLGLSGQFPVGCHVVQGDGHHLRGSLRSAIDTAWDSAGAVRPLLLEAAKAQIEAGRSAYRRLYRLSNTGKHRRNFGSMRRTSAQGDEIKRDHSLLQRG